MSFYIFSFKSCLHLSLRVLGILSLFILIGLSFFGYFHPEDQIKPLDHGDLYDLCRVRHFHQPFPEQRTSFEPLRSSPMIYLLGDSFSWIARGHPSFGEELQKETGLGVELILRLYSFEPGDIPASAKPGDYLVIESVERSIPYRFRSAKRALVPQFIQPLRRSLKNVDPSLRHFLGNLPLIKTFQNWRQSLFFDYLGEISPITPAYQLTPPYLFGNFETQPAAIGSSSWIPDQQITKSISSSLLRWKETAREKGMHFFFLPVPNKATIYPQIAGIRYGGFLPALEKDLKGAGVQVLSLLSSFQNSDRLLYHGTDSHWNEAGVRLAAQLSGLILKSHQKAVSNAPEMGD